MTAEHLAPDTSIQLQWLGFGSRLARGSMPIKRLDCAPTSLDYRSLAARAKVRSFFVSTSIAYSE
jgi:hypothetical protein